MSLYSSWYYYSSLQREVEFQLNTNFTLIKDRFSFCRVEGLTNLLKYVKALQEPDLAIFLRLQDQDQNNITRHLLAHILDPPSSNPYPLSPVILQERLLSLSLIQGLCLMHPTSRFPFLLFSLYHLLSYHFTSY
eukprot:TRINITY_DN1137_c0_g1_i3.p1 TRINITY_DN1137_c0_g1~~TRINITY_DN1137_c0_g1_i3.p1  ORF type:complete len:134 (-),score=7.47 TRINITY_DN1137_c0_g1_i3:107-508(-)